ncbi:MAG TPA: hypothetical protein VGU20_16695 [Stellaceae bacterium]|nr:hypothetical protein [Stellaceae bacterium]
MITLRKLHPVHASVLAQCLGRIRLVQNAVAELAASSKGLPEALASDLRAHNRRNAERELSLIAALLGRILAPIEPLPGPGPHNEERKQ